MIETDTSNIQGELIRKYRRQAKLTQKELGDKIGLSEASIKKFEYGETLPKLEHALHITNIFQFGPGDFHTFMKPYQLAYPALNYLPCFDRDSSFVDFLLSIGIYKGVVYAPGNDLNSYDTTLIVGEVTEDGKLDFNEPKEVIISFSDLEKIKNETADYIKRLIFLLGKEENSKGDNNGE